MAFDVLAFPFIGGRSALNFVGTLGKRGSENLERLRTVDDLGRWADEAGLGPASASEGDLASAYQLREALYGLMLSALDRAPARAADVAVVNEWAARKTPVPALKLRSAGLSRNDPPTPAAAVLAAVARDGIDLLTGPDAALIRECEDPICTLLFIDTSRSHRRRWCSMNSCGARAKMRTLRTSN